MNKSFGMRKRVPPTLKNLGKNMPFLFEELGLPFTKSRALELKQAIYEDKNFLNAIVKKNGRDLLLKARLKDDREVARDLEREIKISRFLTDNVPESKMLTPRVLDFGLFRNLQWYLRQYQTGRLAGQMNKDHGFPKAFLNNFSPAEIAEIIIWYQNRDRKKAKKMGLHPHGGWWYRKDFNFYQKTFLKTFLKAGLNTNWLDKNEAEKAEKILKRNSRLLDEKAKHLCHGDLYPNNIMIAKGNKIIFLDWGMGNFNNLSFDPAFVYLGAWRNEKWRKGFLKHYLKKQKTDKNFAELYRISLISITIRFSGYCWRRINDPKTPRADKKLLPKILENHLKILRTAVHNQNSVL